MARLAPKELNLSDGDRAELQKLVKQHHTGQQIVLRARIILLASLGKNHGEIARTLDIGLDMARLWRNRWLESSGSELSIIQRLQDQERIGAPIKFSMEQVIELFARGMFATRRLRTTNKSLDTKRTGRRNYQTRYYQKYIGSSCWEIIRGSRTETPPESLLVNPPLWMKNLTQKLKILLVYRSARLSVTKAENALCLLMK